ncbi:hypothetical protein NEOLEDRAFT_1221669 [Neolentinus lepideus HHB14362 ss-1]|uniref:Uncharacterized protein n=1 Tax=Neolentinus lepideus HHB14362 ss-1 TaxID=1314782 RepID=A0A165Q3P0_9AGAM|nr:hypothetical protein NEOLEDRAFT_1221669 [Neolentinus lepideus HHB14362 ss-1]
MSLSLIQAIQEGSNYRIGGQHGEDVLFSSLRILRVSHYDDRQDMEVYSDLLDAALESRRVGDRKFWLVILHAPLRVHSVVSAKLKGTVENLTLVPTGRHQSGERVPFHLRRVLVDKLVNPDHRHVIWEFETILCEICFYSYPSFVVAINRGCGQSVIWTRRDGQGIDDRFLSCRLVQIDGMWTGHRSTSSLRNGKSKPDEKEVAVYTVRHPGIDAVKLEELELRRYGKPVASIPSSVYASKLRMSGIQFSNPELAAHSGDDSKAHTSGTMSSQQGKDEERKIKHT